MNRRAFVRTGLMAGVVAACTPDPLAATPSPDGSPFKLRYAPHFGMFAHHAGPDPVAELEYMASLGFRALEDNGMSGRPVTEQERIAQAMDRLGMAMGVFVAHKIYWDEPNLASGRQDWRDEFLANIRAAVDVAKRVRATWMTVVPGHLDLRQDMGFQTANVIESLKQASALLEPHGLVMVLEPLNFRDHPGLFLTKVPQAYALCKAVNSPACKILFDIYHQQITEGNLIPNIDRAWDETAYFQIGDNPGRKEPTSGEINYRNIFRHIHAKGYTGILGMEHGNAQPGQEGEDALVAAYRSVDDF
jgi:hydroxypyruvate isomerase